MNKKKRRGYDDQYERRRLKERKTAQEKVRKPLLSSRENGSKVLAQTKVKHKGRITVHFYGWQIFRSQMKSASEFRVVLPHPLSNEEILKRVEKGFGDLT